MKNYFDLFTLLSFGIKQNIARDPEYFALFSRTANKQDYVGLT